MRKNPIHINESFICENCGKTNEKAKQTCRNHCCFCLHSKHVDLNFPGDRENSCKSLMRPIMIEFKNKKGFQIIHECLKCQKRIINKCATDDDIDKITEIMKQQNLL